MRTYEFYLVINCTYNNNTTPNVIGYRYCKDDFKNYNITDLIMAVFSESGCSTSIFKYEEHLL